MRYLIILFIFVSTNLYAENDLEKRVVYLEKKVHFLTNLLLENYSTLDLLTEKITAVHENTKELKLGHDQTKTLSFKQ